MRGTLVGAVSDHLTVAVSRRDNFKTVITCIGELDDASAAVLREAIHASIKDQCRLIIDMSGVEFCDSTGLGVLVGGCKGSRARNGTLALVLSDDKLNRIFGVTTLDKVFEIHAGLDAAVATDPASVPRTALAGGISP